MHAGSLAHRLDRVAHRARVLYVAAHPDDENTRLLAYLANQRHVTAGYLSLTRGGGGQNLIGREQDELLDVIRTAELLVARDIDGATQRFTRLRDFGFSKSAAESLEIWDHEEALRDVVWVIRSFQPDVIITRFDELPPNHGHHTASAILAREAFAAAADPQRFPDQLADVPAWQAERLLNNVPTWREGPPPADALSLDVSGYDARLGLSYGELAALSRSQHKSQGFGVAGERGPIIERFVWLAGTRPQHDILDGIRLTWEASGKGGKRVAKEIDRARRQLDRDRPERALPALLAAHAAFDSLPDDVRRRDARRELESVIIASLGLFLRATAMQPSAVPGGAVDVRLEVVQRRPAKVRLLRVEFDGAPAQELGTPLVVGAKVESTHRVVVPAAAAVSTPYWLATPSAGGRHEMSDPRLVGAAQGAAALSVDIEFDVDGYPLRRRLPVLYAWTDNVHGERVRDFLIAPPATVTATRTAVLLPNGRASEVALRVRATTDELHGEVSIPVPSGWQVLPAVHAVKLIGAGDEIEVRFTVTAPPAATAIEVVPAIDVGGRRWSYREDTIDYPHIPLQTVLQPARLRLVPLELALPSGPVGYVDGPGDSVAEDLIHVGLSVRRLDDEMLRGGDLRPLSAIVVGIRAYNTRAALRASHARLMDYVAQGGTVVVQYNTNNRLAPLDAPVGPYPLVIGRGRITDERARMQAVQPQHMMLREPNRIGTDDFEGWVQERGLYYGESWDERYQPLFSSADPGEEPLLGGVLVARHGRGTYVYTGLSFFRQLPAGVPGAYRLLANLISGGGG